MAESATLTRRGTDKLSVREIDGWLARQRAGKLRKGDPTLKLTDGAGMYLTVTPAGTAVWRIKFRAASLEPSKRGEITEQVYSLGTYPAVTLTDARAKRDQVQAHLKEGRNPLQAKALDRAAEQLASGNTFEAVSREWLQKQRKEWSAVHYEKSSRALERDVLPGLGKLPVAEIRPALITAIVEKIAHRGAVDTAKKVRQHIGCIFRLAQAKGLSDYRENPAEPAREIIPRRLKTKRRPAMLKWPELGAILRDAKAAPLSPEVAMASRLLSFTAVRISNVVTAEWPEFHLDADVPQWIIPRRKMKAQDRTHDHKVILGETIAAELRAWKQRGSGKGFVFPSPMGGRHITREAIEKAYRVTLGLENRHTPHGWRSAFSTLAREEGEFAREVVELALDHIHDNDVARAYDRGERLKQRVKLMKWWDAQLAVAERGAVVVPIRKAAEK